jgi:PAS domain S-box-containing protein
MTTGRRGSWYVVGVDENEALARAMRVLQETTAGVAGPGLYAALAGGLARAFDMEFAMIAEVDPGEPDRARPLAFWSNGRLLPGDSYALRGTPCAEVCAGNVCQIPSGVQALYPEDQVFVELGVESYAGIPVCTQAGEVIGLITVYDRSPRPGLKHFEEILTAFAVRVGWNLQRERLEVGLRQVVARANALTRIATRLHTAHARPDEAFQEMCAEVRAVLGITAVGVALLDERDGSLIRRAQVGLPQAWLAETSPHSLGSSAERLMRGEIVVISRADYARRPPTDRARVLGLTGSVIAPMRHEGRLIGVLSGLQFGGDWPGRREDIAWLEAVAGLLVEVVVAGRMFEALRRSEQRYRRIVTTTQEGVWTVDAAQRTTFVNQRMAEIVGYKPEELLGRSVLEFIPPEETGLLANKFAERRAGVHDRYEHHFIRKDGSRVAVQASTSPLLDDDGTFAGALAMVRDITELRQLAARALHGQKLESLSVLAGGVAHDFNNLLAVVLGNIGVARSELPAEAPAQVMLADAATAASRAAELTAQMLAYAGKGRFVVQRLNLNRMIGEQLQLLSAVISKKAVLLTEFAEALPEIEGDVAQLRQVLMNLITNASDALGDGPGVITLQTSVIEADRALLASAYVSDNLSPGPRVCLTVRDTGCGFEAAAHARIFDPFFTTKFTGRGLGLAAVVGILRGHHGAVLVESTPGLGSCFRVLLPCASRLPAQTQAKMQQPPRRDGMVLVVDDEPGVRAAARRVLERGGLRVCLAGDGREAISAFAAMKGEIDAVLLDMTMPHLRGDEVYRELRRIRPDVRVVLSSGFSDPGLVADIGGEVGFLAKPWTPQQLLAAVDAALGRH